MSGKENLEMDDEPRVEYDLSQLKGGVKGKYAQRVRQGTNLVLLAPDVAQFFSSDEAVNNALRLLIQLARTQVPGLQLTPESS